MDIDTDSISVNTKQSVYTNVGHFETKDTDKRYNQTNGNQSKLQNSTFAYLIYENRFIPNINVQCIDDRKAVNLK